MDCSRRTLPQPLGCLSFPCREDFLLVLPPAPPPLHICPAPRYSATPPFLPLPPSTACHHSLVSRSPSVQSSHATPGHHEIGRQGHKGAHWAPLHMNHLHV